MKATQTLGGEHRIIERLLNALEAGVHKLEQGGEIRPAFIINAALFSQVYTDSCHHHKEELALFKALIEASMPLEGVPIGVMLAEHENGRAFTRELRDAAERREAGDNSARAAVIQNAHGYIRLLRAHIQQEDGHLFPMSDYAIPLAKHEQVDAKIEQLVRAESNRVVQEKCPTLAERLEKESRRG